MSARRAELFRALQVAIDTTDLARALDLAVSVGGWAQIIELGTPLILAEGVRIVPQFKQRCPRNLILADTKIADAGYFEAAHAFAQGADAITVLGVSDDATIRGCVQAARAAEGLVFADLMHVADVATRAVELDSLGVDVICLHTASDRRDQGVEVIAAMQEVRERVSLPLAVAGGVTLSNCREVLNAGADLIVVGGGITAQPDPAAAAEAIQAVIRELP